MLRALPCLLGWTSALLAQQPMRILGLLRDPSAAPVAGAEVVFQPWPHTDLPVLAGHQPPGSPLSATSDPAGAFHFAADGPGLLFARSTLGLGAIGSAWPGRALRLTLEPMAEVTCGGSEPITVWPLWIDDEGTRRPLPTQSGASVRLPAGRYELWCQQPEGMSWVSTTLRSGLRTLLAPGAERLALRLEPAARVWPTGFPQLSLLTPEQPTCLLLGAATEAVLMAHWPELGLAAPLLHPTTPPGRTWLVPGPPPAQPIEVRLTTPDGMPTDGACVWLLARTPAAGWRLLASAADRGQGRVHLPPLPAGVGEVQALVTAPGLPPQVLDEWRDQSSHTLQAGMALACTVWTPEHEPAVGALVEFVPEAAPIARQSAVVDDAGVARFACILRHGAVRVHDPRLGRAEVRVQGEARLELAIEPGAAVRGRIVDDRGTPVAGALLTLRDPTGRSDLPELTLASAADGSFCFFGLRREQPLVLFAQQIRSGITWSARATCRAGGAAVELTLRNEDPQLDGRAKD